MWSGHHTTYIVLLLLPFIVTLANQFNPCVHTDGCSHTLHVVPPVSGNQQDLAWLQQYLAEQCTQETATKVMTLHTFNAYIHTYNTYIMHTYNTYMHTYVHAYIQYMYTHIHMYIHAYIHTIHTFNVHTYIGAYIHAYTP